MALLGLDVEAARDLSRNMSSTADQFVQLAQGLSRALDAVQWIGGDADTFRSEWSGTAVTAITNISEMLRNTGTNLAHQADQQEQVSRA